MYSGGSVVGIASTIDPEISRSPSLIFTVGSKSAKFGVVFNIAQFEPPVFETAARYPNSETT